MVYYGMLVEGEHGGEEVPSVVGVPCVSNARFLVGKVAVCGHCIAIDSTHGVFLLASAFARR
jgi:hypothetical protein